MNNVWEELMKEMTAKQANTILILIINSILSVIFYNAHYWTNQTPIAIKIRTYVVFAILLVAIPFLVYYFTLETNYYSKIVKSIKTFAVNLRENRKKVVKLLSYYLIGILVAFPLSKLTIMLVTKVMPKYGYNKIVYFCLAIGFIVLITCWQFRKIAYKKIHLLFMCLALIEGMFFCLVVPVEVGVSWDDEIHYQNTTNIVDYFNGVGFKADDILVSRYQKVAIGYNGYAWNDRIEHNLEVNSSYDNRELGTYSEDYWVSYIAYLPSALGIMTGRGLGLSYSMSFMLGRIFGMLFYVGICTYAIKKIISGKILMTFIALFPTTMYMAGSYSYDPWITSISLLGFSYAFNMLHVENVNLTYIVKMLLCFLFAFAVKPVYFPALFFLLFIPKKHFINEKVHKIYICLVFLTAILLAFEIIAPIIFSPSGFGEGDARGGSDVNSTEQVKYILADPIRYIMILFNFFKVYLSPLNCGQYIQNYAYMSFFVQAPFMTITNVVFLIVILFDIRPKRINTFPVPITGMFGLLCAVILIASALYISFTPVGCQTIYGCQFRYLTPLVFPIAYWLSFNSRKENYSLNRNLLTLSSTLFMVTTFMIWTGGVLYVTYSSYFGI